jgi:hypothetical protein
MDGQVLNRGVQNPALSDSQKASVGIAINTSDFARFQQHTGASQGSSTNRVQLLQDDGLVRVGGFEVKPEVAAKLAAVAPNLFVDPATKAAETAKAADEAREAEAQRDELGRHADETLEGYHQHVVGEVSPQSLISLMVYGQKGETPPADLLNNIARDMGETVDNAISKVNAVNAGVQRQFTNLARAMNLDPDRAADWLKDHRKDTSMVALQAHYMRRDVMAWRPLLDDYRAATGDGRKR